MYNVQCTMYNVQLLTLLLRAGHFRFAVLQCSSKSYFQANLKMRIAYFWARDIKIANPKSRLLNIKCKKTTIFHCIKVQVLSSAYTIMHEKIVAQYEFSIEKPAASSFIYIINFFKRSPNIPQVA